MSEMVDRVAKVLSIAAGNHPEACSNDGEEIPMWTLYVDDARAAIEAMREPTEDMTKAAWDDGIDQPLQAWHAMINAALGI
jgi:hypothetical protein